MPHRHKPTLRHRVRRALRRGAHHVRVLSRHPDVRQAAISGAVIGGVHLANRLTNDWLPIRALRHRALRHWRTHTERGTPQREELISYVRNHQAQKHLVAQGLRGVAAKAFQGAARRRARFGTLRRLLDPYGRPIISEEGQ